MASFPGNVWSYPTQDTSRDVAGSTAHANAADYNAIKDEVIAIQTNLKTTIGLTDLTQAEVDQLENIGATTISAAQWGHLGALDQALGTAQSPSFAGLTVTGTIRFTNAELGGYVQGDEIADPGAPAANKGRLFFKDNGSGKTGLYVQFPSGGNLLLAVEA